MFACLYSLNVRASAGDRPSAGSRDSAEASLVKIAELFTPRFEVVGPLVMLDVSGVSRLFGTPRELGEQMRRAAGGPVRIAIAPTQTAAALVALGRPGLVVVEPGDERRTLAPLPVRVLGELERLKSGLQTRPSGAIDRRAPTDDSPESGTSRLKPEASRRTPVMAPPHVGEMHDVLPYFTHSLERTTDAAAAPHRAAAAPHLEAQHQGAPMGGGWTHPRDAHAAATTRRVRRAVTAPREVEHPAALAPARGRRTRTQELIVEALLDTLRRWGIKTFEQLTALPAGDVYERLGATGIIWQRLARGEDSTPLVPWVPEDPFESTLDLEWPLEGLEPLSFVLGRLFEPLAERLERADRGAAILHTHLRLVDKSVHARTVQLPAPMRDPKTLRTLVLLDLESNPPSAGIDRVRVVIEPTPARVTQWALFTRAQPSPEQVSTLLARLTALMGDSHVGSPRLVDSWKPGAFDMLPFSVAPAVAPDGASAARDANQREGGPRTALRRFRLPVPARVQMQDGRPVRITTDRRGLTGGAVVQSAGPWRTSGEWWSDAAGGRAWDRDEWDVAIGDGTIYRLYVERDIGQWFLDGVVD
jgi:protein ImuB